jgi:TPR repeat protein
MTKPTRAWPHLDDAEYDRRVAVLTAAANKGDSDAATALGYLAKVQGDEETAMSWWQRAAANNLTVERNPSTPAEVLAKLAETYDQGVEEVGENPSTPAKVLEKLAERDDVDLQESVGLNPSTPVSALEKLTEHEDERVRRGVARNPATPVALLEKLAEDEDEDVREAVAENPSTPAEL